ncbi:MAG: ATP-binding protein [Ruminococcus flavefaciens]|nr:ATP-binding protein [Ruminococcus flavefaciens]
MPLVPTKNSSNTANVKQEVVFMVSKPKYKLSDLILSEKNLDELQTVIKAKEYWNRVFVEWNLQSIMKQRKSLFVNLYGEPGTGKTMAAHAIASELNKEMICVNYADIESKYVGETSKNLTNLFRTAEEKDVIIFFDEADALLSKRVTNMSSSTDVSVNQTRSVLLTLLNDFSGMVIFATNFISNYDPAFMRRIQYHVKFELPDKELREKLWRMYIPKEMPTDINISEIAEKYDGVSGSDISNAVLKAALKSAKDHDFLVKQSNFETAIDEIIKSKNANKNIDSSDMKITKTETISESEVPRDIVEKSKNM